MRTLNMIFVFILPGILFSSCDILFEQPQPSWITKNETAFPEKIHGVYTNDRDTICISANHIGALVPKEGDVDLFLSDSILLRTDQKNYFLNLRTDNKWMVIICKIKRNKIRTYSLSSKGSGVLEKIKLITPVKEIKNENEEISDYVINPTAEEFKQILDKQIFKNSDTYREIRATGK